MYCGTLQQWSFFRQASTARLLHSGWARVRGTTQIYLHAHMALKEAALSKIAPLIGARSAGFAEGPFA